MSKLYIALDFNSRENALEVAKKASGHIDGFKIGLELFCSCGPSIVKEIAAYGDVFLDLKFHDIPNTMMKAALSVCSLPVKIFNVHALAGLDAMKMVRDNVKSVNPEVKIIAVTMLTSMDFDSMNSINIKSATVRDQVLSLAELTKKAGLDGVVCSPAEVCDIKKEIGKDFFTVVPGIRPANSENNDQKRVATPEQAVKNGADILICGRPIYTAQDIPGTIINIKKEMEVSDAG